MERPAAIHHVGLHVSDIEASLSFYADVLGFEIVARRRSENDYVAEVVGLAGAIIEMAWLRIAESGAILELLQFMSPAPSVISPALPSVGTAHLAIMTVDIHATVDRLKNMGVNIPGRAVAVTAGANKGGWAIYVKDPDGFNVELVQPPGTVPSESLSES